MLNENIYNIKSRRLIPQVRNKKKSNHKKYKDFDEDG